MTICKYSGGCEKEASYAFAGQPRKYCKKHIENGMVYVINIPKCAFPFCKEFPVYNIPYIKPPKFCNIHKEPNMVNVIGKRCEYKTCKYLATFNNFGSSPKFCSIHKDYDMEDVRHRKCEELKCKIFPIYNFKGEKKARFCNKHKKEGMINVISKICKGELCETRSHPLYDGYCSHCFHGLFPYHEKSKNYKTKEKAVVQFVIANIIRQWVNDKEINGGCSGKRPDLYTDLYTHTIVNEIDENQHHNYSCENKRLMEISKDFAHRPMVFIRFNPDGYTTKDGKRIPSPWSRTRKTGELKLARKGEWEKRLQVLKETIEYWLENIPEKTVEEIHLFYDENTTNE